MGRRLGDDGVRCRGVRSRLTRRRILYRKDRCRARIAHHRRRLGWTPSTRAMRSTRDSFACRQRSMADSSCCDCQPDALERE
jgi:hypothetical protein